MIRKLTEQDRETALEYLYKESTFNIFIIGDIEHFGFDSDFQTLYGEFNDENEFLSVLLFYRDNAVYYSHLEMFNPEYMTYFELHKPNFMSSKAVLKPHLLPHFPNKIGRPMYFSQATELEVDESNESVQVHTVQTKEDCEKLYDLLYGIAEFSIHKQTKETFVESKLASINMGTTLYIEEDGIMVSTVATTAETTINAMVVAVATHPDYRGKGYASMLMSALMKQYFRNNKNLCLFYDNPKAGKIYLRLGFKDIGKWVMYESK